MKKDFQRLVLVSIVGLLAGASGCQRPKIADSDVPNDQPMQQMHEQRMQNKMNTAPTEDETLQSAEDTDSEDQPSTTQQPQTPDDDMMEDGQQ